MPTRLGDVLEEIDVQIGVRRTVQQRHTEKWTKSGTAKEARQHEIVAHNMQQQVVALRSLRRILECVHEEWR